MSVFVRVRVYVGKYIIRVCIHLWIYATRSLHLNTCMYILLCIYIHWVKHTSIAICISACTLYMYIYVYYICIYSYICMITHISGHAFGYMCIYACMHAYNRTRLHIAIQIFMYACTRLHIVIHIHLCMHSFTLHTGIHIFKYAMHT